MLVGCARVRRNTECAQTQATHRQNQKYPIYPESQFYYVRGPPRPGATHRLVATALHGQARSLAGTGSGERRSRRGRGEALARARTLRTLPPAAPAPDTHARRMAQGTPPLSADGLVLQGRGPAAAVPCAPSLQPATLSPLAGGDQVRRQRGRHRLACGAPARPEGGAQEGRGESTSGRHSATPPLTGTARGDRP